MSWTGSPWTDQSALSVEMDGSDIIGLIDFTAGEFRKQTYTIFKSFFLKTNEDRNVSANIEFQDTFKAKFGNDGDLEIYHTDPNSIIKSTKAGGTLKIIGTATGPTEKTMIEYNPNNDSIGFDTTFLSRGGAANAGIQFQTNSKIKFFDNILVPSIYISYDGTNAGLSIDSSNYLIASGRISAGGWVQTDSVFRVGSKSGITADQSIITQLRFNGATLQYRSAVLDINGGIVVDNPNVDWQNVPTV
jgi:hypothetical protein